MKKLIITLLFLMSVSVNAFAEGLEKLENAPINNLILTISVAVVLLGIVAVSVANGIMYNKKTLGKTMKQYNSMYNKRRSNSHSGGSRSNTYNNNMQMHDDFNRQMMEETNRQMNQQMMDEMNRRSMEESMKAVTPFDHGGYVQGPGFNPSDTAAQQMNDMNNMNMGMF